MSPSRLVDLTAVAPRHAAEVGSKAWNCARLRQAGFPVPDGFVVMNPHRPLPDLEHLQGRFAVRSSAADEDGDRHSFAGVHETLLNVAPAEIPGAVRRCLASLYAPRALAYRLAVGLPHTDLEMAVLIQEMVHADLVGVVFTRDPAGAPAVVVNAGRNVVDGRTADVARLDPRNGALEGEVALPAVRIRELTALALGAEALLGCPVDVEWCWDGSRFWILQARPITSVGDGPRGRHAGREWSRANLVEILPEQPCPQVLAESVTGFDRAMRRYYGALLAPERELGPVVAALCGRPWINLSQFRRMCDASGVGVASMLRGTGHADAITDDDRQPHRLSLRRRLGAWPALLGILLRQVTARRGLERYRRRCRRAAERLRRLDPAALPDVRLAALLREWRRHDAENYRATFLMGEVTMFEMAVEALCRRLGQPADVLLESGWGEPASAGAHATRALHDLARLARQEPRAMEWLAARSAGPPLPAGTRFGEALARWMDAFGHRATWESDWSQPRYHEDLTPIVQALRGLVDGVRPRSPQPLAPRGSWSALCRRLRGPRRAGLPLLRALLARVRWMRVGREQVRFEHARVLDAYRMLHLEAARRFVARGWIAGPDDYFFLLLDEVADALERAPTGHLWDRALRRRLEHEAFGRLEMPLLLHEDELPAVLAAGEAGEVTKRSEQPEAAKAGSWMGVCLSPGSAEGEVVVIQRPDDFQQVFRGAILVGRAADPSWIPVFSLAAGVILEIGGSLSHAATIAREYGLPVVAGIPGARRRLRPGDRVRLDGAAGRVEVLPRRAAEASA